MKRLIIELLPTLWSPMNTILNFIVCFLCVAQLSSSSIFELISALNELQQNIRSIFLFRKHMEIYNIAKYQNIADRIKRLASSNKAPTQPAEIVSPKYMPKQLSSFYSRNPVSASDLTLRLKYQEKQSQSRLATQETEQKLQQKSMSLINELLTLRQTRPTRTFSRQKIYKNTKILQDQQNNYGKMEQRSIYKRNVQTETTEDEAKSALSKIKSQNSLKIDEILNNYNNYKQNKQQFLQSINKGTSIQAHQRMVSQNLKDYSEKTEHTTTQSRNIITKDKTFEEIDNIWNQKVNQEDPTPKFMRSRQDKKDQFAELTEILNSELQDKPKVQSKFQQCGKGKLVLRRLEQKKENEHNDQIRKMNLVLSPRGPRIPGKICKNNDKSLGVLPKYK